MNGVREDRLHLSFLRDLPLAHGCLAPRDSHLADERGQSKACCVNTISFFGVRCEGCKYCVAFCDNTLPRSELGPLPRRMVESRHCAVLFPDKPGWLTL
jgi:ferredoxin